MEHDSQPEAYCVHVWIRGIHPMLWRRFLVRSDSTLADLHVVLQIGFDWTDFPSADRETVGSRDEPVLSGVRGRSMGRATGGLRRAAGISGIGGRPRRGES